MSNYDSQFYREEDEALNPTPEQVARATEEILQLGQTKPKADRLFRVVLEQISEEVIEVYAESELDAIDLAILGEGELVDGIAFSPTIVHSEELDDN